MKKLLFVVLCLVFVPSLQAKYGPKTMAMLREVMKHACLHEGTICYKDAEERIERSENKQGILYYSCHTGFSDTAGYKPFADCLYRACKEFENQMIKYNKLKSARKYKNRINDCEPRNTERERYLCYQAYFFGKKKDKYD